MKRILKRTIILLLILLLVLVMAVIVISNKNKGSADYSLDSVGVNDNFVLENKLCYEKNHNVYYTIMGIINKYINNASINDTKALLSMFDDKYITEYNITENNLSEIIGIEELKNDSEYYKFNATKVYSFDNGTITVHFVYGEYYNIVDMQKKEINLMLELDTVNNTFNIYNHKYIVDKGYNKLKLGDVLDVDIDKIEKRSNNSFTYQKVTEEQMAKNYLDNYKDLLVFETDRAFEMLDEKYSKLKFENKEKFREYVQSKKIEYFSAELQEYAVEISELGLKTYICKDGKGNYYFFTETEGIMIYEVTLDNYVIPTASFINKYNQKNEQEKVIINIEKFINAINEKSYYYAYNCLSEGFRQNYFKTVDEFEKYAEENFYNKNLVTYKEFEEESGLYKYTVTINNEEYQEEIKTKTFIVKLNEGTDFEMSFNI